MTSAAQRLEPAAEPRPEVDELRHSLSQMFGAERRLRGREHSRPGELTHAQLRSIAALGREREMTAGQLAKSADLNPASVSEMLDHLEAANIVQRHRSTEDRRVCIVSLTDEGWQLLERKLGTWQALWDSRFSQFTHTEIEAATRIMHELTDMFDSIAAASSGRPEQKP
jgi:DNA-binding MarR family transcriptional regulator